MISCYDLLSVTNIALLNNEANISNVRKNIGIELNKNNHSDWNTSDSSSDNEADTNEELDKEKRLVSVRSSKRSSMRQVYTCLWNTFINAHQN